MSRFFSNKVLLNYDCGRSKKKCGVSNLWLKRRSNSRREHSNLGKLICHDAFKVFIADAPYYFFDKKLWCTDKRDTPWDICLPAIKKHEKRRQLVQSFMTIIDERNPG